MSKIAFMFAGQGSQYIGMGKEIANEYDCSRQIFEEADEALGFKISELCFEGQKEELDITENTQPAILATSIAILRAIEQHGIKPDVVAGLSLGEYAALVCSEMIDFSNAVQLVKKRGKFMQEAVPVGVGTMTAIIGLDREKVIEACEKANEIGIVQPANYNCKGQIVIAGEVKAVEKASELANEFGARRVIPLSVSGPFHTKMLQPAAEKLFVELDKIDFKQNKIPYITNVTGKHYKAGDDVKEILKQQVMSSVYWEDTINTMINDGVETFIEIGPGKALSGFVKKTDRKKKIFNVEDIKSLNKLLEAMRKKE